MPSTRTWFVYCVKSSNLFFAEVNLVYVVFFGRSNFAAEDVNAAILGSAGVSPSR
jgi:hypothetical protein